MDAHSGRNVMNFPVSWSAPDRVVTPMKIRHGLPTIPCSVNGHVMWLIVDTGSEGCVLEAETARDAEVRMIAGTRGSVAVTGARGKETARLGIPDAITIGAWHWQGLPWIVRASHRQTPEKTGWSSGAPMAFNILGMSAMQAMCTYVTIDYARGAVIFGFRQPFQPVVLSAATHQPFEVRHGVPFVKVAHGGHEWASLLDTGASAKMEINQFTAERFELRKQSRWVSAAHLGLGQADDPAQRKFENLILGSVTCLGRSWRNTEAMVVENESKIGSGLCREFRLTVDFAGSQIWLETPRSRGQ